MDAKCLSSCWAVSTQASALPGLAEVMPSFHKYGRPSVSWWQTSCNAILVWRRRRILSRKYCWTVTSRLSLRRCASIYGVEVLMPKRLIMRLLMSVHSISSSYHSSAMPLILNKKARMGSASGRLCVSTSNRVSHVCTLMSLLIHRTYRVQFKKILHNNDWCVEWQFNS